MHEMIATGSNDVCVVRGRGREHLIPLVRTSSSASTSPAARSSSVPCPACWSPDALPRRHPLSGALHLGARRHHAEEGPGARRLAVHPARHPRPRHRQAPRHRRRPLRRRPGDGDEARAAGGGDRGDGKRRGTPAPHPALAAGRRLHAGARARPGRRGVDRSDLRALRRSRRTGARLRRRGAVDRRLHPLRRRDRRPGGDRRGGAPGARRARLRRVGRGRVVPRMPARVSAVHPAARVPRRRRYPPCSCSGDHAAIARWRRREALRRTCERRPDLLARAALDADDREFLATLGWPGSPR